MQRLGGAAIRAALGIVAVAFVTQPVSGQQPARHDATHADTVVAAQRLPVLVVTASRHPEAASQAPVAVRVIDHAAITRSGAQDLNGLLTQSTGIQPDAGAIGSGGVRLQGLSSQHVLVLVDGQPLVGRIDGELDLTRIPTSMVDRVEVIDGPMSTLYGSAAMGGVINVITRRPGATPFSASTQLVAGSQQRRDATVTLAAGTTRLAGTLDLGRQLDQVQPGRTDQRAARDDRWNGNARVTWAPKAGGVQFDAAWLGVRQAQRWQQGQLFEFADNIQTDFRASLTVPAIIPDGARLTATLYASEFSHLNRQATLPEPVSDAGDHSHESLVRAEATWLEPLTSNALLNAGLDVDRESLRSDRIGEGNRSTISAEPYAQLTMTLGSLDLVPGMRISYNSRWHLHATPKLAALWHLPARLALRASIASGYRAPDFKELDLTFFNSAVHYVVHGNPDLQPETSLNAGSGLTWTGTHARLAVSGWINHFSGFIQSVQLADSGRVQQYTYGNIAHGSTRGIDVEASFSVGPAAFDAAWQVMTSRDDATGLSLLGVTPRSVRLGAHATGPLGLKPSVTVLFWSATPSSREGIGAQIVTTSRSAFTRVDARVARSFGDIEVQIGAHNLVDARATDWPGITARQWYTGVSVAHSW